MIQLRIDPEFRDKIPPLTDAEFEQLRENILNDGEVYEPIAVWNGTIVDGHNRYKIVQEHPEIPYRIKEMDFSDKWAAFEWMYKKQLGRRNLTDEQKTYMIGKMYEARKMTHGGDRKSSAQNGHMKNERSVRQDEAVGKELGIGHSTVRRAGLFSKGVDAIREQSDEAAEIILQGGSGLSRNAIQDVHKMEPEQVKELVKAIESGPAETKKAIQKLKEPVSMESTDAAPEKQNLQNKTIPSEYAETRRNYQRIEEVSAIISSNRGNEYTVDDAVAELEVIYTEFIDKAKRVLQIRRSVINGDKKVLRLIYKFADEIENLKEELEIENPETSV